MRRLTRSLVPPVRRYAYFRSSQYKAIPSRFSKDPVRNPFRLQIEAFETPAFDRLVVETPRLGTAFGLLGKIFRDCKKGPLVGKKDVFLKASEAYYHEMIVAKDPMALKVHSFDTSDQASYHFFRLLVEGCKVFGLETLFGRFPAQMDLGEEAQTLRNLSLGWVQLPQVDQFLTRGLEDYNAFENLARLIPQVSAVYVYLDEKGDWNQIRHDTGDLKTSLRDVTEAALLGKVFEIDGVDFPDFWMALDNLEPDLMKEAERIMQPFRQIRSE